MAEDPKEGPLSFEKDKSLFMFLLHVKETYYTHQLEQEFERKLLKIFVCFVFF